jgi:hypothetical protein
LQVAGSACRSRRPHIITTSVVGSPAILRSGKTCGCKFRAEVFNLPNHPNFNYPNSSQNSPSFGHIALANDPRQIQLGQKLVF